jgi:hypothetical protein
MDRSDPPKDLFYGGFEVIDDEFDIDDADCTFYEFSSGYGGLFDDPEAEDEGPVFDRTTFWRKRFGEDDQ